MRLPRVASPGAFARVLLRRRTWRRFGPSRLPLRKLAALLELTFGARRLMAPRGGGPSPIRSSSGTSAWMARAKAWSMRAAPACVRPASPGRQCPKAKPYPG
ncbi:MAG TPA: hypothetical protein VD833_14110 [Vicinamibacterales bacterium]|nr:hypothetical protein [Vicinamibacterales bacterium]